MLKVLHAAFYPEEKAHIVTVDTRGQPEPTLDSQEVLLDCSVADITRPAVSLKRRQRRLLETEVQQVRYLCIMFCPLHTEYAKTVKAQRLRCTRTSVLLDFSHLHRQGLHLYQVAVDSLF